MRKNSDLDRTRELMDAYRDMTNKYLDSCLLVIVFLAENKNMSAAVIYLGSLHSLHFETYLERLEYTKTDCSNIVIVLNFIRLRIVGNL